MATLEQLELRVSAETGELQRALGDIDKQLGPLPAKTNELRAALERLGGTDGLPQATITRLERLAGSVDEARRRSALLTAALSSMRREAAQLEDTLNKAQKSGSGITAAQGLAAGQRLIVLQKDIKELEASAPRAVGRLATLIERENDAIAIALARKQGILDQDVEKTERQQIRALRGFGQGILRGAGAGFGVPLSFGLSVTGGLLAGQMIGRAIDDANDANTKLTEGLRTLRNEAGLSVDAAAKLGAQAARTGVDLKDLAEGAKAAGLLGLTFEQATAKIAAIEDPSLRAAEAQRIFGDAAAPLIPILTEQGRAAKGTADEIERLRNLQLLEFSERSRGGTGGFFENIIQFAREAEQGRRVMNDIVNARNAATREAINAGKTGIEVAQAAEAAERRIIDALREQAQAHRDADRARADTSQRSALFGQLRDALPGDAARALDLAVKLRFDDASILATLRHFGIQLEGITADSVSRAVRDGLERQLSEAKFGSLVSLEERREAIGERILDIEERIADRQKDNAEKSAQFSKAELEARLRARDEQRIFIEAAERAEKKRDTSRLDARDARDLAKLRRELGQVESELASRYEEMTRQLGDIVRNAEDGATLRVEVEVTSPDGSLTNIDRAEELLVPVVERRLASAAARAAAIVRNTRPSPFAVSGAGAGGEVAP